MSALSTIIAKTPAAIQDAQRVRFTVYVDEEGLLPPSTGTGGREIDAHDDRDTTVHFVAYAGSEPVGTMRLLLPDSRGETSRLGLDLEAKCDLSGLVTHGVVLAEGTRFCVLSRYRHTGVASALFASLLAESKRRGVTHWVAAANMETDVPEDAALAYRVAHAERLMSPCWCAASRIPAPACTPRRRPVYTHAERIRAADGDLAGIRLPRTLSLFVRRMAAHVIGPPLYDASFNVFALPLVTALMDLEAGAETRATPTDGRLAGARPLLDSVADAA
jgi:GNAT superfamily N-acetyltransferase